MIARTTLVLVVVVSCAHALVHMFEHAFPSVELEVAAEYFPGEPQAGKEAMGFLSACWRLPWGLGALLAGWLVDRFGARHLLAVFLIGSGICYACLSLAPLPLGGLTSTMLLMGTLAAIYHPAGLALISHQTTLANRPLALGIHGVFGSAGTAAAPLLAGAMLSMTFGWRSFYGALAIPAVVLGLVFAWQATRGRVAADSSPAGADRETAPDWVAFFVLTALAFLQGFVYSALVSFLRRYLEEASVPGIAGSAAMLTGGVLVLGCIGQFVAGTMARPARLEQQLTWVTLANVPLLLWMAVADDWRRIVAAGLFTTVHYMHQPLYNSLVAKYTPRRRRSLCYGFSFAMGLGIGGLGAWFAGKGTSDLRTYGTLAVVALLSACLGMVLCYRQRSATPLDAA